jgi:multicomponent Na+:H+ antiporter subunit F
MITDIPQLLTYISLGLLILALILAFLRLLKGPSINDRIAAMDFIASVVIAFILIYCVLIQKKLYIDIAIIISLISFVGTIAISTYLKQKEE